MVESKLTYNFGSTICFDYPFPPRFSTRSKKDVVEGYMKHLLGCFLEYNEGLQNTKSITDFLTNLKVLFYSFSPINVPNFCKVLFKYIETKKGLLQEKKSGLGIGCILAAFGYVVYLDSNGSRLSKLISNSEL